MMASSQGRYSKALRKFQNKIFSSNFDFVRSPLIMMAVYDMITSVHTAMEAFYYANHYDRPLLGRKETEKELIELEMRAYGIFYSWALLGVLSFVMSIFLIISTIRVKTRLLLVWSAWETIYIVASATLNVLGFQYMGIDSPFQVIYLVFPRLFGLYGIFVILMHYRNGTRTREAEQDAKKESAASTRETKKAWSSHASSSHCETKL